MRITYPLTVQAFDRYNTDGRPIFRRQSMLSVSAECRPLYRPKYLPILGRYVDHHSADISVDTSVDTSTDTSRSTYINNSCHLARKYARIFVRGHYLFREANSFPRAKLEENCELRGTDNVQGQIPEHIFAPNGGYFLHYPSNLFRNARNFQN